MSDRFCVDCKHQFKSKQDHLCGRNLNSKICLVRGIYFSHGELDCYVERNTVSAETCEPEGKFFKQLEQQK